MPPYSRMQTLNGPHTSVQGSSIGVQDGPSTSGRIPETLVPHPPSMDISVVEFRGAIQMLTQLVAAQS
ncbi:hypothetical protein HAX54_046211, partial [Datura stramonium]|nr:hypothetical protein [Datura stramonium]